MSRPKPKTKAKAKQKKSTKQPAPMVESTQSTPSNIDGYTLPEGHVLVVRTCDENMRSHDGAFQWPTSGRVSAPDWRPTDGCGHGLHGWLWGQGDLGLRIGDRKRKWLVVEVRESELVDLDGKVKFPSCAIIFIGAWWDCFALARKHRPKPKIFQSAATAACESASATGDSGHASATGYSGHASATGDSGHASATGNYGHASATGNYGHASATGYSGHASATGYSGHASATGYSGHASATGYYGHASATGYSGHASATGYSGHASATGYSGHASATGYYGHASATGYYGHASATGYSGHASATGYSGHASATGYSGHASATGYYAMAAALGLNSWVRAGEKGAIIAAYFDRAADRPRVVVGYVGEDGIKPNTWYRVRDGKLVEESE